MMRKKNIIIVSLLALCVTCAASGAWALNSYTAKAATEDVFHELGASVRVSQDKGIRFAFGLPESLTGDGYEIGTLVIPKSVLGTKVLNHNDDPADEVDVSYEPIACTKNWVPNEKLENAKDGYKYYNAALTEIPQLNYDTTLVARSYYVKNGVYTYSDPVERSMGYVAAAALNDGYEDTNNILADIVTTAYGETALNIEATEDIIGLGETTALVAENEKNYLPIWSVANPSVVNIDKTGTVTAVAGGMTTVTAQIGSVSATKDIYVASADLKGTEFNKVSWGWNNAGLSTTAIENGYSIAVKFAMGAGGDGYWLNLSQPKSYYEKLAEAGYKLTFDLAVTGHSGDGYCGDFNWPLIKVFGKTLEEYGFTSGTGKVTVSMDALVVAYDMQAQFLGGQVSDVAQTNYWFTIDRKDDYDRYFNLAITNYEYVKPVELAFVNASDVLVDASQIIQLDVVTNVPANEIAWKSSDDSVATVENGVVKGVKGGIATITASAGNITVSKTVYVVSADLKGSDFNKYSWTSNNNPLTTTEIENGYSIAIKFNTGEAGDGYWMTLSQPKSYYEKLAAEGYALTFDLSVTGHSGDNYYGEFNWPLIKVFGKTLEEYGLTSGQGTIVVSMNVLVAAYDMQTSFVAGGVSGSTVAQTNYWFTIDRVNDYARFYNLAITNYDYFKPELAFENAEDAVIGKAETLNLDVVTNVPNGGIVWKSSDATVATVENGVVKGVKGGIATITASAGNITVSKTVYVVSADLKGSDFNKYSWGVNNNPLTTTEIENGYSIAIKFNTGEAGDGYWMTLSQPKSYYEKLAAEGYVLTFDLSVTGHSGDNYYGEFNWPLIKVFGKTLEEYGFTTGTGTVTISMDALVAAYDMQASLVAGGAGNVAQSNYWFTIDRVNDYARFYNLTITNYEYVIPTELAFADNNDVFVNKSETLKLDVVTNVSENEIVWNTSDAAIATVENGVVTGVKGGIATITASAGNITVSKTVYVVSADLKGSDFNKYSWGANNNSLTTTPVENGYSIAVKFNTGEAGDGYWMTLSQDKSYYEKLAEEGYTLTFDLSVSGHSGDSYAGDYQWPLIKVFGETLEEYGFTTGTGTVTVSMDALVAAYDMQASLVAGGAGNVAQSNYWFTIDRVNDYARFYNLTITNYRFVKA